MRPFVMFAPPHEVGIMRRLFSLLLFHIVAASASMLKPLLDLVQMVRTRRWNPGSVAPLLQLVILLLRGWQLDCHKKLHSSDNQFRNNVLHAFLLWVLIWSCGSLYFFLVVSVAHNQESNMRVAAGKFTHSLQRTDWGAWQLGTCSDIAIPLRGAPLFAMTMMFLH